MEVFVCIMAFVMLAISLGILYSLISPDNKNLTEYDIYGPGGEEAFERSHLDGLTFDEYWEKEYGNLKEEQNKQT